MVQTQDLMSKIQMGRWSEEERMVKNGLGSEFNEQDTNAKVVRGEISPRIQ